MVTITETYLRLISLKKAAASCHTLPVSLWNSSLETASAQESKYFCRVSTCLHRMSRNVSISANFSRNLWPFWAERNTREEEKGFRNLSIHLFTQCHIIKSEQITFNLYSIIIQLRHSWSLQENVIIKYITFIYVYVCVYIYKNVYVP